MCLFVIFPREYDASMASALLVGGAQMTSAEKSVASGSKTLASTEPRTAAAQTHTSL